MYSGAAKIVFKTIDLSELPPSVATSIGAVVIGSNKGDADAPVLITNEEQFIQEYGKPEVGELQEHAALGFLQNGRRLYVQRVHKSALYGGAFIVSSVSANPNAAIAAGQAVPASYTFGTDQILAFFGADPGTWNDDIKIAITVIDAATYKFKVDVYQTDDDGVDQQMETFIVSRKHQLDGFSNQMYIQDVINGASNYIKVVDNTAVADTVLPKATGAFLAFAEGDNGVTVTSTEIIAGWAKFTSVTEYPVNILINAGYTDVTVQQAMKNIAEARVDCTCILDTPYASINTATGLVTWRQSTQNFNSSFCALYGPWIKIFDKYNGQVIGIPPSGDIGAVYALTDFIYGSAHGAPAGFNRGVLARALQLDFGSDLTKKAWTPTEMSTLDDAQINPILNDPGFGIVVWGEGTEQSLKTALSSVHIRRLINQIAVQSTRLVKSYLFEPLIDKTYFRARMVLETYMAELEGLGAFDNVNDRGWKVICDSTNNSASDRDNEQMNVWLFVKPVKIAKYIEIKCVITRSTASFEAIIAAGTIS